MFLFFLLFLLHLYSSDIPLYLESSLNNLNKIMMMNKHLDVTYKTTIDTENKAFILLLREANFSVQQILNGGNTKIKINQENNTIDCYFNPKNNSDTKKEFLTIKELYSYNKEKKSLPLATLNQIKDIFHQRKNDLNVMDSRPDLHGVKKKNDYDKTYNIIINNYIMGRTLIEQETLLKQFYLLSHNDINKTSSLSIFQREIEFKHKKYLNTIFTINNTENTVIAFANVHIYLDPKRYISDQNEIVYTDYYVNLIIVKNECSGKGIGTLLLTHMLKYINTFHTAHPDLCHLGKITLSTNKEKNKAAYRLYQKFGFKETEYGNPPIAGNADIAGKVFMAKDIYQQDGCLKE